MWLGARWGAGLGALRGGEEWDVEFSTAFEGHI